MISAELLVVLQTVVPAMHQAHILDAPTFGTLFDNALMRSVLDFPGGNRIPWFNNPTPDIRMRHFYRSEAVEAEIQRKLDRRRGEKPDYARIVKEHVVPRAYAFDLYRTQRISIERLAQLWSVVFITKDEDARINQAGFQSKMPEPWDVDLATGWERYDHPDVLLRGRGNILPPMM